MIENDNILLEQFFQEAATQQLEDNGFSERVSQAIERSAVHTLRFNLYAHLWTLFCIVVAFAVFLFTQGWNVLVTYATVFLTNVEVFLRTLPVAFDPAVLVSQFSSLSPQSSVLSPLFTILLSFMVLMVFSIIGLTRWVSRWV